MASETEWQEAYAYLLARLQTLGAEDVIREIEESAAMPVKRAPSTGERVLLSKLAKRELGQAALEAPTRQDAFHAALLVLEARLVHLPAILGALLHQFQGKRIRILSEYGADRKVEDREDDLLNVALREHEASAEVRQAVESLRGLFEQER